jgi:hypothetical protein
VRAFRSNIAPSRVLTIVLAGLLLASPVAAEEAVTNAPDPATYDCSIHPLAEDGSRRQTFDSFEPLSGIAALPPRIDTELVPGQSATYCVGFQNRGAAPIALDVEIVDLAADELGNPASQREAADRGASKWLTIPTDRIEDLAPGDIAWLEVDVRVPDDALAGSSYASILGIGDTGEVPTGEQGDQVQSIPSVTSQLFFNIPGDAERSGEVVNVRSPRVIWWDGFGAGDLPVLDRLRGLGVATIRFDWRNSGAFTSEIGGTLDIRSDLSDKSVAQLPIDRKVVLAGTDREFEVTWKQDIPLIGRFTPTLKVAGESGRVEEHELEPIWVIPAWWYLLAVALAIGIPLWMRRRSKRRYAELLERVEAAEHRSGEDDDMDDDSASDWR